MKTKLNRQIVVFFTILFLTSVCLGDTFKNVQTGETFNGFPTQKVRQGRTYVYSEAEGKFKAIHLGDWGVTYNALGRRNSVAIVELDDQEVLLSKVISDAASEAIIDSSNKGALAILVEIDLPGGRGEYARALSDTIKQTTNCPVIAFVRGGDDGGAYSVATAVAFACDKIYISSNAVLGSEAPMVNSGGYYGEDFYATFNSANLASYKGYIGTLAESNGRPNVMAMAMLDSQIDVVEISGKDGKKSFINRENRIASQTVLRGWSNKKSAPMAGSGKKTEMSLVLQPNDAVYAKMADAVVDSREDILKDIGASDAKLLRKGKNIIKNVKKFIATRRSLSSLVANIYYLEDRSVILSEQISDIQKQSIRTTEHMVNDGYRSTPNLPFSQRTGRLQQDRYQSPNTRARRRQVGLGRGTTVTETSPMINDIDLLDELSVVLVDLTRAYNRTIVLGRRFPGALPTGLTVGSLEKQLYAAEALYDDVAYRR